MTRIHELVTDPRPEPSLIVRVTPQGLRDIASRLERLQAHGDVTDKESISIPFTERVTLLYEPIPLEVIQ